MAVTPCCIVFYKYHHKKDKINKRKFVCDHRKKNIPAAQNLATFLERKTNATFVGGLTGASLILLARKILLHSFLQLLFYWVVYALVFCRQAGKRQCLRILQDETLLQCTKASSEHDYILYNMGMKEKEHEVYFLNKIKQHKMLPFFEKIFSWGKKNSFNDVDLDKKCSVKESDQYCRK